MDNKEIDTRLVALADCISQNAQQIAVGKTGVEKIAGELELMNMSLMGITAMLGEIAKRLPESKEKEEES